MSVGAALGLPVTLSNAGIHENLVNVRRGQEVLDCDRVLKWHTFEGLLDRGHFRIAPHPSERLRVTTAVDVRRAGLFVGGCRPAYKVPRAARRVPR